MGWGMVHSFLKYVAYVSLIVAAEGAASGTTSLSAQRLVFDLSVAERVDFTASQD